jgi:hypothetical protein
MTHRSFRRRGDTGVWPWLFFLHRRVEIAPANQVDQVSSAAMRARPRRNWKYYCRSRRARCFGSVASAAASSKSGRASAFSFEYYLLMKTIL